MSGIGIEKSEGLSGSGDAARDEQLGQNERKARIAGEGTRLRSGWVSAKSQRWGSCRIRARFGDLPLGSAPAVVSLLFTGPAALTANLLVLVVVRVRVVDDDVVKALDVFEQRLIALVPLGGGFVQEHNSLIDETELNVSEHAGVLT